MTLLDLPLPLRRRVTRPPDRVKPIMMRRLRQLATGLGLPLALTWSPVLAQGPASPHAPATRSEGIGFRVYEVDLDRLRTQEEHCARGCDDCVPDKIHHTLVLNAGSCGDLPAHRCPLPFDECSACNGPCGASEIYKIWPIVWILALDPSTVHAKLGLCKQLVDSVYCADLDTVNGAYNPMFFGVDLGMLLGNPGTDYDKLRYDQAFLDVINEGFPASWFEYNEEKAFRLRIGAFAVLRDRLGPPTRNTTAGSKGLLAWGSTTGGCSFACGSMSIGGDTCTMTRLCVPRTSAPHDDPPGRSGQLPATRGDRAVHM